MKRRLTKLVLFVLLGAIINVAVAWGWPFVSMRCSIDNFTVRHRPYRSALVMMVAYFCIAKPVVRPQRSLQNWV